MPAASRKKAPAAKAPPKPSFIQRALALSGGRLSLSRSLALASPRGAPFDELAIAGQAGGGKKKRTHKKKKPAAASGGGVLGGGDRADSGAASPPGRGMDAVRFVGGATVPHGAIGGNAFGGNRPRDGSMPLFGHSRVGGSSVTGTSSAGGRTGRGMLTSFHALLLHRRSGGSEPTFVSLLVSTMREHDARLGLAEVGETGIPDRDSDAWAVAEAEATEASRAARELQYQMAGGESGAVAMPASEARAAAAAAAAASVNVYESGTFLTRHASVRDPAARSACDALWRVLFKEPDGTVHATEFVPFARRVIRALLPLAPPALIGPLAEEEYHTHAMGLRTGVDYAGFHDYMQSIAAAWLDSATGPRVAAFAQDVAKSVTRKPPRGGWVPEGDIRPVEDINAEVRRVLASSKAAAANANGDDDPYATLGPEAARAIAERDLAAAMEQALLLYDRLRRQRYAPAPRSAKKRAQAPSTRVHPYDTPVLTDVALAANGGRVTDTTSVFRSDFRGSHAINGTHSDGPGCSWAAREGVGAGITIRFAGEFLIETVGWLQRQPRVSHIAEVRARFSNGTEQIIELRSSADAVPPVPGKTRPKEQMVMYTIEPVRCEWVRFEVTRMAMGDDGANAGACAIACFTSMLPSVAKLLGEGQKGKPRSARRPATSTATSRSATLPRSVSRPTTAPEHQARPRTGGGRHRPVGPTGRPLAGPVQFTPRARSARETRWSRPGLPHDGDVLERVILRRMREAGRRGESAGSEVPSVTAGTDLDGSSVHHHHHHGHSQSQNQTQSHPHLQSQSHTRSCLVDLVDNGFIPGEVVARVIRAEEEREIDDEIETYKAAARASGAPVPSSTVLNQMFGKAPSTGGPPPRSARRSRGSRGTSAAGGRLPQRPTTTTGATARGPSPMLTRASAMTPRPPSTARGVGVHTAAFCYTTLSSQPVSDMGSRRRPATAAAALGSENTGAGRVGAASSPSSASASFLGSDEDGDDGYDDYGDYGDGDNDDIDEDDVRGYGYGGGGGGYDKPSSAGHHPPRPATSIGHAAAHSPRGGIGASLNTPRDQPSTDRTAGGSGGAYDHWRPATAPNRPGHTGGADPLRPGTASARRAMVTPTQRGFGAGSARSVPRGISPMGMYEFDPTDIATKTGRPATAAPGARPRQRGGGPVRPGTAAAVATQPRATSRAGSVRPAAQSKKTRPATSSVDTRTAITTFLERVESTNASKGAGPPKVPSLDTDAANAAAGGGGGGGGDRSASTSKPNLFMMHDPDNHGQEVSDLLRGEGHKKGSVTVELFCDVRPRALSPRAFFRPDTPGGPYEGTAHRLGDEPGSEWQRYRYERPPIEDLRPQIGGGGGGNVEDANAQGGGGGGGGNRSLKSTWGARKG